MAGFHLKIKRLTNIPYASSIQEKVPCEQAFEVGYSYLGEWNQVLVKPILLHSVVVYLVQPSDSETEPMGLVYNTKNEWSDIEKGSTAVTRAVGLAIENYYSDRYLLSAPMQVLN